MRTGRPEGQSSVGAAIRSERARRGLTQVEFAKIVGVSQPEIARWESGRVREIKIDTRERLADVGIDRMTLGIAGFSIEKLRADVEAAQELAIRSGKPKLALAVLEPPLRWMEGRWGLDSRAAKASSAEMGLLAQARLTNGLALTLAGHIDEESRPYLELAEAAYHQVAEDQVRFDGLSDTLILSGNEARKLERYDVAVADLGLASSFARQGELYARSAEAEGLLAYAHANLGDRPGFLKAIRASEDLFERAPSRYTSVSKGVFTPESLAEIRLRCELIVKNTRELRHILKTAEVSPTMTQHWKVFYSVTVGVALAGLREIDATSWFEIALDYLEESPMAAQLDRVIDGSSQIPGNAGSEIRDRAMAMLGTG